MKKLTHPALVLAGLVFAAVALSYLWEVYEGISKHTPPCAPIGRTTVSIVFGFITAGTFVCIVAVCGLLHRKTWLVVSILALVLNVAALSTWGYWIHKEMLLPYHDFCDKVGMP